MNFRKTTFHLNFRVVIFKKQQIQLLNDISQVKQYSCWSTVDVCSLSKLWVQLISSYYIKFSPDNLIAADNRHCLIPKLIYCAWIVTRYTHKLKISYLQLSCPRNQFSLILTFINILLHFTPANNNVC